MAFVSQTEEEKLEAEQISLNQSVDLRDVKKLVDYAKSKGWI